MRNGGSRGRGTGRHPDKARRLIDADSKVSRQGERDVALLTMILHHEYFTDFGVLERLHTVTLLRRRRRWTV